VSETRDHLKTIATDQICKNNLAAASFREMGKAAGIKSSSVHYHFKSRDALLLELATDYQHAFLLNCSNAQRESPVPASVCNSSVTCIRNISPITASASPRPTVPE
tara:strand:+ start:1902 stop:2219 length:318 start_codon:yes stop_codon:yes gene_type:complete